MPYHQSPANVVQEMKRLAVEEREVLEHIQPVAHQAKVGPLTVHYEVAGEGKPVVLIHGLSGSGKWWTYNVPVLAKRFRVYNIDLIGFGRSRKQRFVLHEAARWLREWLDMAGIARPHLIGHSMGGYIALELAATFPQTLRRLVLIDAAALPIRRGLLRHTLDLVRALRYMRLNFLPVLVRDFLHAGPRTMIRATREILSADLSRHLHRVQAKTLVIWGENDTLLAPELGRELAAQLGHARFVKIEGAGHNPMWDRPERFNELVLDFLDGND